MVPAYSCRSITEEHVGFGRFAKVSFSRQDWACNGLGDHLG